MKRKYVFATRKEWEAKAEELFGIYLEDWKFKCPKCGNIATGEEYKALGLMADTMYFECIGRYDKTHGCDWHANGLFDICTTEVGGTPVFDFAYEQANA